MARKGFPYREKKKAKTKVKEDHRPHLGRWTYGHHRWASNEWITNEPETVAEKRKFHIPDLRHPNRVGNEWTRQEAHTLIDMWAEVSWGLDSERHRAMSRQAGYFNKLWRKQKGMCALTGIPLYGAPGCRQHGIGIDIINFDFGIQKGNIRLVSAPMAITRLQHPDWRTQQVASLNPKDYEDWPVFWAVLKHIHWWLVREQPFKNKPVQISFPVPTLSNQDDNPPKPWIEFKWLVKYPSNDTREAWDLMKLHNSCLTFCSVMFKDDYLYFYVLKGRHTGSFTHADFRIQFRDPITHADFRIQLCDPTIHIEKKVVKIAYIGYPSLSHHLAMMPPTN